MVFAFRSFGILAHHQLGINLGPTDNLFFPAYWLILPPSLYFYAKEVFVQKVSSKKIILHFIPYLLFLLCTFIFIESSNEFRGPSAWHFLLPALHSCLAISVGVYFFYILQAIKKGNATLQGYFSETSEFLTIKSVKRTIYIFLIFFVYVTLGGAILGPPPSIWVRISVDCSIILLLSFFSFYVINHALISHRSLRQLKETQEIKEKPIFTVEKYKDVIQVLEQSMSENKYYLDHKISIPVLSTELEIPMQKLSMAINAHYGHNFFHYINALRIAHACKLLKDPAYDNRTLVSIAEDSGFSSKSTFNTRFKEVMNMTPSAYRKG